MKLYLFYIPSIFLCKNIAYTVSDGDTIKSVNGVEYKLYAFTTDKKKRDKFIEDRIDDFICIPRNIEKEEYGDFKKSKPDYELMYIRYKNYSYKTEILSNMNEYNHCKYGWCEIFNEKDILSSLPYNLVEAINNEYQEHLAVLGLNSLVIAYDDELSSMLMNGDYEFNDDCVFTILDQEYHDSSGRIATVSLKLKPKEYNLYIHEFKKLYK